jgi:hypothetical protein
MSRRLCAHGDVINSPRVKSECEAAIERRKKELSQ